MLMLSGKLSKGGEEVTTKKQALEARIEQLDANEKMFRRNYQTLMETFVVDGNHGAKERADVAHREANKCRDEISQLKKEIDGLSDENSS
jgi:hypothetical protein